MLLGFVIGQHSSYKPKVILLQWDILRDRKISGLKSHSNMGGKFPRFKVKIGGDSMTGLLQAYVDR